MIPFPYRLTTGLAALAVCVFFSSCKSTESAYNDGNEVDYTGSVSNPNPRLPKEEYPFDSNGNYREDWAARGAGVSGVKDRPTDTALYTQSSDSDTPVRGPVNHPAYASDDTPSSSTTFTSNTQSGSRSSSAGNRSSSSSGSRSSTASNRSGSSSNKSSSSSSQRRTTSGSRSVASSSSKSKPKPKTTSKPVAKTTVVKVKSTDTLYGLAKKHGVSVAAIKSANGLKSDRIVDGKSLKIPKKK